jgi:hypothetical protein
MIDDVADLHDESGWSSDEQQRVDRAAVNPRGCNGRPAPRRVPSPRPCPSAP